jgi:ABC-2 type transport system ATP-binding protein
MKVLEIENLRKTFASRLRSVEAVKGLSLTLAAGEILAFLGPNGAGKTTTIKMIAGLIRPDSGSIRILGADPHRDRRALGHVGAVLEGNRNIYWRMTPAENLEYFGVLKGLKRREARERARALLERFGLADRSGVPCQQLSRGMQQQVALAVALIHRPALLLLDEPTLGLDVGAAERMKRLVEMLAARGQAIVLTTHQLAVAEEIAQRVAIIDHGEILTEEATAALVQRSSGRSFRIRMAGRVNGSHAAELARLGASLDGSTIEYAGDAEGLYRIFDVLRPLPIAHVEKVQASLTEIFLNLTAGKDPRPLENDGDV